MVGSITYVITYQWYFTLPTDYLGGRHC